MMRGSTTQQSRACESVCCEMINEGYLLLVKSHHKL